MASSRCSLLFKVGVGIRYGFRRSHGYKHSTASMFWPTTLTGDLGPYGPPRDSRHPSRQVGPRWRWWRHRDQCGPPAERTTLTAQSWLDGLRPRCARKFAARSATLRRDPRLVGRGNGPAVGATWAKCARRAATFPTCWAGSTHHPLDGENRDPLRMRCISCSGGPTGRHPVLRK